MDLSQMDPVQIITMVAVLAVVWIVLRFVLKLATKILATGCVAIVLFGIVLFVLNSLR